MVFNHTKQSSADHTSDQFACEHARRLASDDQLAQYAEDSPSVAIPAKSPASGEGKKDFLSCHKDFENETADHSYDNSDNGLSGNPNLSWVTGNTSMDIWLDNAKRPLCDGETCEHASKRSKQVIYFFRRVIFLSDHAIMFLAASEDMKDRRTAAIAGDLVNQATSSNWFCQEAALDSPIRIPSYPSYYGDTCQAAESDQVEDRYSPVFYYHGRKHVPIGANHQADIPEWGSHEFKNHTRDNDVCASPMTPVTTSMSCDNVANVLSYHKMECSCLNAGSIRCVRQHVMQARQKLKQNLGHNTFLELGFGNMGEVVTEKWTEEEEQLFYEVVLLNPASLGKNFWKKLPQVFRTRSSKELISYYFNVFMLRKRAEQNRLDPLHVDSDDDEWQESDYGESSTEEDSVVESPPADQDIADEEDDLEEAEIAEEADDVEDCVYYHLAGYNEKQPSGDINRHIVGESTLHSSMTASNLHHFMEEHDIQDDSCTSYEGQPNGAVSCDAVDISDLHHGLIQEHENLHNVHGLSGLADYGFFDGHYDLKSWDMRYSCGTEKDDFFSTCNVIEEVFGKEPWDK
ncbi:hypothetical protein B296_00012719 [Ensete ventricosum]|uniref:Myb-like domain-containing protein n=1 Tax=Ensete ventricosum TaxID=4639 RepID=A0A427B767_ENSVE|nr:hypothetical protein B296_00012719 [Ensete ventricosum]